MGPRQFALRFDRAASPPSWTLAWVDDDTPRWVAIDCDVEPVGGTFSRGDCVGELAPQLPPDLRARFIALTKGMGYPVSLDEINATLLRLDEGSA